MCNLYNMTSNVDAMARLFRVKRPSLNLPQYRAIFPAQDAPVVRLSTDGERELSIMNWGFVLPQQGKAPKRVTNARNDKVTASPFWKGSFEERRCLVPATSFAEPKGKRPAIWHWFALKGDERLFAFAGVWRHWRSKLKDELVEMDVYAIMTTTPNEVVKPIHPSRMPVMLDPADYETWLNGSALDALTLTRPFPAERMEIVATGKTTDGPLL